MVNDLSKIAYFVPNLPRFTVDEEKFWKWWEQVNIPINRIQRDSRGNGGGFNGEFWNGVTIWQQPSYQKQIVWKVNYHSNDELFSELIDRVISSLPWYDVQGLTLWSNKIRIPPHQDGLPKDPFPSAPRINLFDRCDQRTFYVACKTSLQQFVPDLQTGSNLFLFNNENFYHGAKEQKSGSKILVRIDGPLVDPEGLQKFIRDEINNNAKYEGMEK